MRRVSACPVAGPQGEIELLSYQLYFLRNGVPAGGAMIDAHDDAEACRMAEQMERLETVEVWRDGLRLQTIFPARRIA